MKKEKEIFKHIQQPAAQYDTKIIEGEPQSRGIRMNPRVIALAQSLSLSNKGRGMLMSSMSDND